MFCVDKYIRKELFIIYLFIYLFIFITTNNKLFNVALITFLKIFYNIKCDFCDSPFFPPKM